METEVRENIAKIELFPTARRFFDVLILTYFTLSFICFSCDFPIETLLRTDIAFSIDFLFILYENEDNPEQAEHLLQLLLDTKVRRVTALLLTAVGGTWVHTCVAPIEGQEQRDKENKTIVNGEERQWLAIK